MMIEELEKLTKKKAEKVMKVHNYIKNECETNGKGYVEESYKEIGQKVGIDRPGDIGSVIKILQEYSIISVEGTTNVTKPNTIKYNSKRNERTDLEMVEDFEVSLLQLESMVKHNIVINDKKSQEIKEKDFQIEELMQKLMEVKRENEVLVQLVNKRYSEDELQSELENAWSELNKKD